MNLLYYLFETFYRENQTQIITLLILSLAITIVQTNAISFITANIIQSIESNHIAESLRFFRYFIGISVVFLIIYYAYKFFQNNILTRMTQWIKHEIFRIILLSNNENMKHVNFIEFITPITRISISCYVLFFDIITVIIPTIAFLFMISAYFIYHTNTLGMTFLLANAFIAAYLWWFWNDLTKEKNKHETHINNNEKFIIDILNNIDKVIYRGQTIPEIHQFTGMTQDCIHSGISFLSYTTNHVMVMTIMVYITLLWAIWYLIELYRKRKLSNTMFITFFTILLLYRDRMLSTIQNIPDYLEFVGRLDYIMEEFTKMIGDKADLQTILDRRYKFTVLDFAHIRFRNVNFEYQNKKNTLVFENLSLDIHTTNKIVGVTGLSGKGKSSFAKLLLRLYEPTSGIITIDGKDISTVDPDYIRANITYVNQNSKLFDKKIIDNIVYGCKHTDTCNTHLDEIMQYPKIRDLYKNVDILNGAAGSLGENLSGGQRQVVNIMSGLINPSKILILDEPTNALDSALKSDVIAAINHFRKYKQCIIIITHDKDVYSLFDETIQI